MKRFLSILAVLALVAMTVQAVEVKSQNVAGVVNVSLTANSLSLVGVSLDGFYGEQTLESLFGAQAVTDNNYNNADLFLLWDEANTKYNQYAKAPNNLWYRCNTLAEWNAGSVQTNPTVSVGSALWIKCNPSQVQTFALTGQAVQSSQFSMTLANGLQMIAYPFSSGINLDATTFTSAAQVTKNDNYNIADQAIFWTGSDYQPYAIAADGSWYGCKTLGEWNAGSVLGSDKDISLGEGFWYRAINGAGLTWDENNPYLANL